MHLWQFSFIAALFAPAWLLPAVAKDGESVPMVSHEPISATVLVAKRDGKKNANDAVAAITQWMPNHLARLAKVLKGSCPPMRLPQT